MIVLMEGEEREREGEREREKAALTGSECGNGEGSRSFQE